MICIILLKYKSENVSQLKMLIAELIGCHINFFTAFNFLYIFS